MVQRQDAVSERDVYIISDVAATGPFSFLCVLESNFWEIDRLNILLQALRVLCDSLVLHRLHEALKLVKRKVITQKNSIVDK